MKFRSLLVIALFATALFLDISILPCQADSENSKPEGPSEVSLTVPPGTSITLTPQSLGFSDPDNGDTLLFAPRSKWGTTRSKSKRGTYTYSSDGKSVQYTVDTEASKPDHRFELKISDFKKDDGNNDDRGNKHAQKCITTITFGDISYTTTPGDILGTLEDWPLWPKPFESESELINDIPATPLTTVGQNVLAWVNFSVPGDESRLWGQTLSILVSNGNDNLSTVDVYGGGDWGYFVPPDQDSHLRTYNETQVRKDLQDHSVLPSWEDEWIITDSEGGTTPNQTFPYIDNDEGNWKLFHQGDTNKKGEMLADSGHAWPVVVQKKDPWTSLVSDYQAPSGWENPWLFLPTNDGTLNIFEITEGGGTQANRYQQVVPGAAFPVSVYQEHLKVMDGYYSRLTMLDGPIKVSDVQSSDGNWQRILIGTTGLGVELQNKPEEAWTKEIGVSPTESPEDLNSGHHFAIYALDVSDPDDPKQLWTISNTHWDRKNEDDYSESSISMERCVSRSVIGYTLTDFDDTDSSDNRTWHALFVGLDADDNLMWLDLDPLTGEKRDSGTFNTGAGKSPHENLYPSRILAAYPKVAVDNEDYNSPLLSDLYVLLSTGELFFWNLQASEAKDRKPFKLVSFYRPLAETFNHFFDTLTEWGIERPRTQPECPPVSNFDIAYYEGKTYFAATLDTDYLHAREHNSLVILELETLLGNSFRNGTASPVEALMGESLLGNYKTMVPISIRTEGLNGLNDNVIALGLPLKSSSASGQPVSDPLFLQGKLYFAAFPGPDEQTLLYHIPLEDLASIFDEGKNLSNRFGFWDWLFSGNKKDYIRTHLLEPLAEGNDYTLLDSSSERPHLIVDSSGTLIVTESDGDTIASEDVMGNLGEISEAGDVAPEDQMQVVYWKED